MLDLSLIKCESDASESDLRSESGCEFDWAELKSEIEVKACSYEL